MMRWRVLFIFISLLMPFCGFADTINPLLNKVSLQLTAEKWATTNTARVQVNVDAALDKIGLADINNQVLQKLQSLANQTDWHITQVIRTQDKSGLEQMHIEAEARVPTNALAALRDKAKTMSKPGETYTIATIDFMPSLAETEFATQDVRNQIYTRAKQEVEKLNQLYPEQHFFLYSIDFNSLAPTLPLTRAFAINGSADSAAKLSVNTKMTLTANVVIAAPTPINYQLPKQ